MELPRSFCKLPRCETDYREVVFMHLGEVLCASSISNRGDLVQQKNSNRGDLVQQKTIGVMDLARPCRGKGFVYNGANHSTATYPCKPEP